MIGPIMKSTYANLIKQYAHTPAHAYGARHEREILCIYISAAALPLTALSEFQRHLLLPSLIFSHQQHGKLPGE